MTVPALQLSLQVIMQVMQKYISSNMGSLTRMVANLSLAICDKPREFSFEILLLFWPLS